MSKITKLTDAQINRFPEFVQKWTEIGLCTKPADRKLAEEGINEAYTIAGINPPKKIVWCDSPLSQGLTHTIVIESFKVVRDSVKNSVVNSVWNPVGNYVGNYVRDSVRDSVRDYVGDYVGDYVWVLVVNSVWNPVVNSVWNPVGNYVKDSVRNSVRNYVGNSGYGQHESGWLSFYDYFRDVCSLTKQTQKLEGLWKIAKSAGWWIPYQNICWVSERHNVLHRDDRGRLHCENGPALQYPDGWNIWSWHGVLVTQQVIEQPDTITVKEIQDEQNEEIRRIMIERMGWPKYLRETNSKMIHHRYNTIESTKEALMDSPNGRVLLCACPSTAKVFALGVPREIKTCEEAQNWLSGGLSKRIVSAS